MIHVLATIDLHPGRMADFLKEFALLVPLVRAEHGCIEYGPTIDAVTTISAQSPRRSDTVVVVEKWESLAALEAHLIAPHMIAYRPKVKDTIEKVSLQILTDA